MQLKDILKALGGVDFTKFVLLTIISQSMQYQYNGKHLAVKITK